MDTTLDEPVVRDADLCAAHMGAEAYEVAAFTRRLPAAAVSATIVDVLLHHDWADESDPLLTAAHSAHHYDYRCAVCRNRMELVAHQITARLLGLTETL